MELHCVWPISGRRSSGRYGSPEVQVRHGGSQIPCSAVSHHQSRTLLWTGDLRAQLVYCFVFYSNIGRMPSFWRIKCSLDTKICQMLEHYSRTMPCSDAVWVIGVWGRVKFFCPQKLSDAWCLLISYHSHFCRHLLSASRGGPALLPPLSRPLHGIGVASLFENGTVKVNIVVYILYFCMISYCAVIIHCNTFNSNQWIAKVEP